ncbi:hypothetical protein KY289_021697 [Solanum tuberosum]|nr:hypothetical protein KY289_021697 [Solanum tuberosum]
MTSNTFSVSRIFTNRVDIRCGNVKTPEGHSYSIIKRDNTTHERDIIHHYPINGSTSSYQWIINEASSSHQLINIILPVDQHHPTNGSSTKHHYPVNGSTSSYQWIINEASSSHQWINIILPMDKHHPTNGSSTKHHHPINGALTSSPDESSIIILSMEHRRHYPIM